MQLPLTLPRRLPHPAEGLGGVMAQLAVRPAQALVTLLVWIQLQRIFQRIADLFDLWKAGCLPAPPPRAPRAERRPQAPLPIAAAPQGRAPGQPRGRSNRPRATVAAPRLPAKASRAPWPTDSHAVARPAYPRPGTATLPSDEKRRIPDAPTHALIVPLP